MQIRQFRIVALWLVVIAVLLGVFYFLYQFYRLEQAAQLLPPEGTKVRVVERGVSQYYVFWKKMFVVDPPPVREDGVRVVESVPSPVNEKETVVLAAGFGIDGVSLGILREDQSLDILLAGETAKADLIVTKEGIAIVSARRFISFAEPIDLPQEGERGGESEVIDAVTVSEPSAPLFEERADVEATSVLYAVNLHDGNIRTVGSGRNPRLLDEKHVLAVNDEGIVSIDIKTGEQTVLVPYPGADNFYSSVSPTGTLAAVGIPGKEAVDIYEYANGRMTHLGTFTPRSEMLGTAFLDDEQFVVRYSPTEAALYKVPRDGENVAMQIISLTLQIPQ